MTTSSRDGEILSADSGTYYVPAVGGILYRLSPRGWAVVDRSPAALVDEFRLVPCDQPVPKTPTRQQVLCDLLTVKRAARTRLAEVKQAIQRLHDSG